MTKNNILLIVPNKEIIPKLKERNVTLLYPLEGFTVGFKNTFNIKDIKDNAFIFLNRIFDNEGIIKVRDLLSNLPANIKGIVFDDIGVLNILLDLKLDITKILFLNHLNCNYDSINAYLEYVDSVVVSTDLKIEETKEILERSIKPLVLYTFGHINIMYSRRLLLTNYHEQFNKDLKRVGTLEEIVSKNKLKIIENDYGTVIYTGDAFNGLPMLNFDNVLYNLINPIFISDEDILKILDSDNMNLKYPYKYLSDKDMIVKLGSVSND